MLRSLDSWTAVASAMVAARAGSSRRTVTAEMRAALSAWSASRVCRLPSSSTTAQVSLIRSGTTQVSSAATAATARAASASTAIVPRARLGMEGVVERDARALAGQRLDGAGHRVAAQQQVVLPGELPRGDHRRPGRPGERDLGAGRDVEPGLHDAVI